MKYMTNKGFSKIELLFIIVIVSILALLGITIVTLATNDKKETKIKDSANSIINNAKQFYEDLVKEEKTDYIITSEDGLSKGMCITLEGMQANDLTENSYKDYDGYVVVEEYNDNKYYTLWLTNKDLVIDGYESKKIDELSTKKNTLTKYKDEVFTSRVRTSFTGSTMSKGGTGTDSQTKVYQSRCINEKIE